MNDFQFYCGVDLKKSLANYTGEEDGKRVIYGMASTPDYDTESERVLQEGLDVSYFKSYGFFNYDHRKGPEAIVGYPYADEIKVTEDGFSVAGELFKGVNYSDQLWNLVEILHKSNAPRSLAFSIEGKILEEEKGVIKKAMVTEVAITPRPVNPRATLKGIVKSMTSGVDEARDNGFDNFLRGGIEEKKPDIDPFKSVIKSLIEKRDLWKEKLVKKGELSREEAFIYLLVNMPQFDDLINLYNS